MNRRRLLQGSLGLAALLPVTGLLRRANADLPALAHPLLVHNMMLGGPDLRHLLPPAYDAAPNSYGNTFYRARAGTFRIDATDTAMADKWQNGYIHVVNNQASGGAIEFGILNGCDWLADMYRAGHVAIVTNVVGAESRDHEHAQRVWESADRTLSQVSAPRTGWGGRLADAADSRVFSLTATPRPFCFNHNTDNPTSPGTQRVLTLADPQSIGLFEPPSTADAPALGINRALKQYYTALAADMPVSAPQRQFVGNERQLRALGDTLRPLFAGITLPPEISGLLAGANALGTRAMAVQTRNLYYALAASREVDFHSASIAFGSWDTHDIQIEEAEPKYRDIFGSNGALANLYRVLPTTVSSPLVFMFSGEFGRQLRGNGDHGTDHGRGTSVILVGYPVRGGVYGEQFPTAELARIDEPSPDIEGRTHIESVLAPLVDYLHPGNASTVLPSLSDAKTEAGVDLSQLLRG